MVQDTTSLNYSAHPLTEGLGPISPKPQGVVGLLLHDSMAFNLAGTPLGLVDVQCWARVLNSLAKGSFVMSGPSSKKRVRSGLRVLTKSARLKKAVLTLPLSVWQTGKPIFMSCLIGR